VKDTTSPNAVQSDPHWGTDDREKKARNTVHCFELLTDKGLSQLECADIGRGSGGISYHLAPAFRFVCGVSPAPWEKWKNLMSDRPSLTFCSGYSNPWDS